MVARWKPSGSASASAAAARASRSGAVPGAAESSAARSRSAKRPPPRSATAATPALTAAVHSGEAAAGAVGEAEVEGEGGDHRAGRRNVERQPYPGRDRAAQPRLERGPLGLAVGDRDHPDRPRRDADLGARHLGQHRQAEAERLAPALGRRIGGRLEHVGHLVVEPAGPQRRLDAVAAGFRHEADQRDLEVVAQQLEREGRGRGARRGGERGRVGDPALVDGGAGDLERAEAAGLVGRGAGQRHPQAVGGDGGPVLAGRGEPVADLQRGGPLNPGGRSFGELERSGADAGQHGDGEKDGAQAHGSSRPPRVGPVLRPKPPADQGTGGSRPRASGEAVRACRVRRRRAGRRRAAGRRRGWRGTASGRPRRRRRRPQRC